MTIQQAENKGKLDDLQLISDTVEVNKILSYLGKRKFARNRLIEGLFVGQENGDYTRVYGFRGSIPYNEKELHLISGKYERTIDKIINKVDCRRGAPMGRSNVGTRPNDKRIYDCAVPMPDGCCDKGGAYWGIGSQLRVSYTKDLSYIEFYRA